MLKKVALIASIIIVIVIFYSFIKQAKDALQADKRVEEETDKTLELQKKNLELRKKLSEVQTTGFIESQARDKLNLQRPGEKVVIISQDRLNLVISGMEEKKEEIIPNWEGWLRLFWK